MQDLCSSQPGQEDAQEAQKVGDGHLNLIVLPKLLKNTLLGCFLFSTPERKSAPRIKEISSEKPKKDKSISYFPADSFYPQAQNSWL